MAISISRAGKLIIGEDGYVTATLDTITVDDIVDEKGRERTQLQYVFKVPTTKGTADKYLWTGLNVNPEKTYYPVDANTGEVSQTGEYNKLTQLLLALGIISELQLHSGEDIDLDIETLIGKAFKFKVIPNKQKPSLSDIDLKSICFVKTTPTETKKLSVGTSK
jgi:hypothetical protein